MKSEHGSKFARRHNGDGTVDSICLTCYQTAAIAENESQLPALESRHKCSLYGEPMRAETLQLPTRKSRNSRTRTHS
jgi:hypothetical protein